jgi:hypothetical protein
MSRTNGVKGGRNASPFRYIPCRVEPGMFREQWLVYLDVADPGDPNKKIKVQLLVDQREVTKLQGTPQRNNPASGWLRVSLLDKEGEFIRVILPQPSTPAGDNVLIEESLVKQEVGS